jgi:hypothetical protein
MEFDDYDDTIIPTNVGTLTIGGNQEVQGNLDISSGNSLSLNSVNLIMQTTPTISSGFGTSASVDSSNGTATFRINTGTTGASSGVIGMPTAANGWNAFIQLLNPASGLLGDTTVVTATTASSISLENFSALGIAANWPASTMIMVQAEAY